MKRGEIWTLRDNHYASKARPVVVIQNNVYNEIFFYDANSNKRITLHTSLNTPLFTNIPKGKICQQGTLPL